MNDAPVALLFASLEFMATVRPFPSRATASRRLQTPSERSLSRSRVWLVVLIGFIIWLLTNAQGALAQMVLVLALVEGVALTATRFTKSPLMWITSWPRPCLFRAWRWTLSRLPALPVMRADRFPPRDAPSRGDLEAILRKLFVVLRGELDAEGLPPLDEMGLPELAMELLDLHWPRAAAHVLEAIFGWPRVAVLSDQDELLGLMNRLPDGQLIDAHGIFSTEELGVWLGGEPWRVEESRGRLHAWRMDLDDCDLVAAALPFLPGEPFASYRHQIEAWFNGGAANDEQFVGP